MGKRHLFEGTLEITTSVGEKKGCAVACKICPQPLLVTQYKGETVRYLTYDNFKKILSKVPKTYRIDFSGYAEPFLAKDCVRMIKYASDAGYYICCYTTLIGVTYQDIDILETLSFSMAKKCPLHIHLPDANGVMPIKVTEKYKNILKYLISKELPFVSFMTMDKRGKVHPDLIEIMEKVPNFSGSFHAISRASNLDDKQVGRKSGKIFCRPMPKLNHNVLLPNGNVQLCCMDYGLKHTLGNLLEQEHSDLFKSDAFLRLKSMMLHDNEETEESIICRYCEKAKSVSS